MAFPSTARDGQTHNEFGKKYVYSEISGTWAPVVPLASLSEIRLVEQVSQTATASYATAAELPLSGNTSGKMAFVQETNRLYIWSGTGWYNIATITSAAASISGANSSYNLATDGTPIVITLNQSGLTSPTWSYSITSGSIGKTAVITQADNVFTITPSTQARNIGSFGVTFKATDGSNTIVTSSQFTMSNTAPVIDTGPSATYALASDGTPTVITLAATDADGHAITWSYEVVSGSLGGTTVTNVGPVFTITPSTDTNDGTVFQLRFVASDGAASDTEVAEFTLQFWPDWSNPNLILTITGSGSSFSKSADFNVDHDYIILGAVGESPRKAYIYDFNGTLVYTINNPRSNDTSDAFASDVAISGNVCVVAAAGYPNGSYYGRIYIYKTVLGDWSDTTLAYTIENPNATGTVNDQFGTVVLIDGNYIVATAVKEDVGGTDAGSAYVISAVNGSVLHTINNPNSYGSADNDRFGEFASMSGNYAIITTVNEDTAAGQTGAAYIFNVTTGNLVKTLNSPNNSDSDTFGISSSIKGNYCVVGARGVNWASDRAGKAYVYKTESGDWSDATLLHTLNNPNDYGTTASDNFGTAVALNDSHILVGADQEDAAGGVTSVGRVYIFKLDDGSLVETLLSPLNVPNAYFGGTIRLTNTRAMIGTEYNRAYFYEAE